MMRNLSALVLALALSTGCAAFQAAKPVLKTIDDVARQLCLLHYSEKASLSVEEAAEFYCKNREQWEPWIGPALSAQKVGGAKSDAQQK
jgi:hypothetical protein